MGPREFRTEIVLPDVADFQRHYADMRAAHHAIASVDALAAHIYAWCQQHNPASISGLRDDSAYRQYLSDNDPDFRLIRDIAKAHKHVVLTRHTPEISRADAVAVESLGFGKARWGEGRWGSPPQVVVKTNSGEHRIVDVLVVRALECLDREMVRLGVP